MSGIAFIKMHGLGNDFVVIDARAHSVAIDAAQARAIADRHTGVGCDQVVLVERPRRPGAQALMRIRNADGSEVDACGNASRCVAALLMRELGRDAVHIETGAGLLEAELRDDGLITVDMGAPRFDWRDIPLAAAADTLHLALARGPLADPVATSMGNPHATFFVPDVASVDLAGLGPALENDPIFPERANIGIAQILDRGRIRLRVWERGSGITRACGTGASAAAVAAIRRGLTGRDVEVVVDGGTLFIEWLQSGRVLMTGPSAVSFTGVLDQRLLG